MKRTLPIAIAASLAVILLAWWVWHRVSAPAELVLYGNVDLREVDLAFNNSERIASVAVQEGDRVHKGEILARLDTSRLAPIAAAAAAALEVDEVNIGNTQRQYQRLQNLSTESSGGAVSRQALDEARAAAEAAAAHADVDKAQLALLRQELADAALAAPSDAVVHTRILEPGEMSSPQKPVFSLAITDPKWVRVYVPETDLPKIRPRMDGYVTVDAFPDRHFAGWIGFISPVAEFTPKTVETPELRTSLVYEVRVFVRDPGDVLRLGMPATVHVMLDRTSARAGG